MTRHHLTLVTYAEHTLDVIQPLPESLDFLSDDDLQQARLSFVRRRGFVVRLDDLAGELEPEEEGFDEEREVGV